VSGGGEEIGESWVIGGGVLPLKGRLPLGGARCDGRGGSGLEGRELLLRGGAIVSLNGSGVIDRPSMDSIGSCSRDPNWLPSSSLDMLVAGIVSSGWILLGDGKAGLDLET